MKIVQLKTNHVTNPLGYMMTKPVLSYKVIDSKGTKQTYARIKVSIQENMTELVYDSGNSTEIDSIAYHLPIELKPCTRYYWTVTVVSDAGEIAESDIAWFETGKMDEEWLGKWICSDLNACHHPYFFTDFELKSKVKKARLYICGLGLYEAYINGEKVSDECLTPYQNNYDQWLQYQTYDVSDMLTGGKVQFDVLLGNGWYKGRFGLDSVRRPDKLYGDTLLLNSELKIEYIDGSIEIIATDENWKARKSKIQESSIYDGEVYDETFNDDTIYPVKLYSRTLAPLRERLSLPIKVKETIKPVKLIKTPKGELVLDLGQNHSGWFSLKVNEPKGTVLKVYFGEELQDGCFFNGNLRTAKAEYTYISDGNEQTIRPHFTFYAYRYVKLEGFTNVEINDYTALVLYSDLNVSGHIETDNPLVNRLFLNALWGQKSNFLDVPMDCPQRDERMGWTGDAQIFTPTACFNMDSYAFYKKYLYDMYEEQKMRNGAVPFVVPAMGQTQSCAVWGDAATIIPWVVYQFFGDKSILEEQYDSMKAWVEYIREVNGDNWRWREIFTFGDWLALNSRNPEMPNDGTDPGYIATVYYYNSTLLVSKVADILGKIEEAETYKKRAEELLAEIHKEYFSPTGRACISNQTGLITALNFGLAIDKERTVKDLRKEMKMNNDKLNTGFVGTALLCNVLSENGLNELAYTLLLNEEYPGWLNSVKMGATTIWERWDSLDQDGHFSPSGLNSLNHYSYGSIVEWMYRHAAGLNPVLSKPGFREVNLLPKPDYRLKMVDASFDSPIGVYRSKWEISANYGLIIDITVPFGGRAYLTLPFAPEGIYQQENNAIFEHVIKTEDGYQCILESGTYHIEYATTVPMRKVYTLKSSIAEIYENEKAKAILLEKFPIIDMLPPFMHDKTFFEVLKSLPTPVSQEELDKFIRELSEV